MRQAIALLLASLMLAGCGAVGNVVKKAGQVLMDPSIPVGEPEDQPTRIALSLYAAADVNPNAQMDAAEETPAEAAAGPASLAEALDPARENGPFVIQVHSATRDGLIQNLDALLGHLRDGPQEAVGGAPGTARPDGEDDVPLPLAGPAQAETGPADKPPLGQYRKGASLSGATEARPLPDKAATPIAFRVLQLKDDSLLENADPDLLRANPAKALGSTFLAADDYVLVPGQFKFINFTEIDKKARYVAVVAAFHDPNAARWHDVFRLEPRGRTYALLVTLQNTRVAITDESYRPAQDTRRATTRTSNRP
ncbi:MULTISPECIES: type VI secretion system lipoprotein TssJ [Cupriavidus]